MVARSLKSERAKSLVDRIRNTKSRSLTLRKPLIEPVDGRVTVLALSSGTTPLGTVHARTRQEASRFLRSQEVNLTIGWDRNRNEKIFANFVH